MKKAIWQTLLFALIICFISSYVYYWLGYYYFHVLGIHPKNSDTMIWLSTGGVGGGIIASTVIAVFTFVAYLLPSLIIAVMLRVVALWLRHPMVFLFACLIITPIGPFWFQLFHGFDNFNVARSDIHFSILWITIVNLTAFLFFWFSWRKSDTILEWE